MVSKKWRSAALGSAAVFLISALLLFSDAFSVLRYALYDFDMRQSMDRQYHHDIVVVGIDDESLGEIGAWPWKRSQYIPVIRQLEASGAKVIAFDIMFNEAGDPESDRLLAEELAKYDNIIFPSQAVFEGRYNDIDNTNIVTRRSGEAIRARDVVTPLPLFAEVTHTAHINAKLDKDGVIRSTFLEIETPQGTLPSLAVKAAELAGADVGSFLQKYPDKEMLIRYELLSSDFQTIPFSKITPETNLKDRIVLVGFTASGFEYDDGKTPVETNTKLVYVHANIIHQLLNGTHVAGDHDKVTLLLIVAAVAAAVLLAWLLRPTLAILLLFLAAAGLFGAQYGLFAGRGMFVNAVDPAFALFASFLVNISVKAYFESKQKNYITKQFGRYISPDLVEQIAKSDKEIELGGISKELTILFLDVRGFTSLSEKMQPEEVVGFLNAMFNLITEKALENKGTIDKFIGDAAMILFNAPLDLPNHEYRAVKTAYDIQKGMEQVRKDVQEQYGITLSVGIGINTGEVVVGNIGSYLRVDYTAIGDNVNTAARIESSTTANQILVSQSTYERTKEYFEYKEAGEKLFKGKTVPIKLYEVTGFVKPAD